MFRIGKSRLRPVRYVRMDVPADEGRCRVYLWQSDRRFRFGDTVAGVPGWGRVAVVDDPATRGGVEHIPVAAPGWTFAGEVEVTR